MAKNYKFNAPPADAAVCDIYLKEYPNTAIPTTYNLAGNYFVITENNMQVPYLDVLYWVPLVQ